MSEVFDIKKFDKYKEDNRREVKKAKDNLPVSLWDTYSSFANCYGGVIILGVKEREDGSWYTTGLKNPARLQKNFWDTVNNRTKVSINLLSEKNIEIYELNGDTIAYIDLQQFVREEDDMYINFDMTLLSGNDMFKLGTIEAWYIDGSSGVTIFSAEHGSNEFAGMTVDEVKQKIKGNKALNDTNDAAYCVYTIMAEYCADLYEAGEDIKKKLESDFPMCNSSEGLDLAGDEPKAEGDKYVYNEMHESGYTDGKASISGYDKEKDFIETAVYTSTDGVSGHYPVEE